MDIPIYDPRDDYDYVPARRHQPEGPEQGPDRELDPEKETDERSPIQRRLESLTERAANRRVISPEHSRRERTVRHEQPREEIGNQVFRSLVPHGASGVDIPYLHLPSRTDESSCHRLYRAGYPGGLPPEELTHSISITCRNKPGKRGQDLG